MKFEDILKDLKVSDEVAMLTKQPKKAKKWTKVKDNIPLKADLNFCADLLFMPEDKNGYQYLFVIVDLATGEFDMEPLKNKTANDVKNALEAINARKYIKVSKQSASVSTDDGSEFKGIFHKWLKENNVYHKISLAGRHQQTASVESLNKQLGYLFNSYMNQVEKDTGQQYKNWTDVVETIREQLNKMRKRPEESLLKVYKMADIGNIKPKFKVGDVVYYKSEVPLNALGEKQPTANSRMGDFHYNVSKRKIVKVLVYNGDVPYRYMLDGIKRASFTDNELILANGETESTWLVEDLINKRTENGKVQYLVKWKGYPVDEATWENVENLIADGFTDYIERYEEEHKPVVNQRRKFVKVPPKPAPKKQPARAVRNAPPKEPLKEPKKAPAKAKNKKVNFQ